MEEAAFAWDAANAAARASGVVLRPMASPEDPDRVLAVIQNVWGEEAMPRALVIAFRHAGVIFYGAGAAGAGGGEVVGFVLGFPGWDGGLHVHSHMLAVLPDWQSRGVGYALKLAQRAACLDRGIVEVRWTFDPMVSKNAWFNLVKLGTGGRRFFPDFYGDMPDLINRGDSTDRFEVVWALTSERVALAVAGNSRPPSAEGPILVGLEHAAPIVTGEAPAPGVRVTVPRDYHGLRARDPKLGRAWREACRQAFAACFERGLVPTWITQEGQYIFERADLIFAEVRGSG
jgi:predicted GNAT superfamily acetyltransferase